MPSHSSILNSVIPPVLWVLTMQRSHPPGDIADNRLPAVLDVDVLHDHSLLAAVAVFAQCLHLGRVGSRQTIESRFMGLIPGKLVRTPQKLARPHHGYMGCRHLHRQHPLDRITGRDVPYDGWHEIALVVCGVIVGSLILRQNAKALDE